MGRRIRWSRALAAATTLAALAALTQLLAACGATAGSSGTGSLCAESGGDCGDLAVGGPAVGAMALSRPAPVTVRVYVMSQCPFASKALGTLIPIVRGLGDAVVLDLQYIGRATDDGQLTTMHGESELEGNLQQICVRHYASAEQWLGFVECQMAEFRSIPNNFESCAEQGQIDLAPVRQCVAGGEGGQLLAASFETAEQVGARGSPTFEIAGAPYTGSRSEQAFARAVCSHLAGRGVSFCEELPPATPVPVVVLEDRRCQEVGCDMEPTLREVKSRIAGAQITRLDYSAPQAGALFSELGLKLLPVLLVSTAAEQDEEAERYVARFDHVGDYYAKRVGRFDPVQGVWQPRPAVPVQFLVDGRCETRECEAVPRFEDFLGRQMPGVSITRVEFMTDQGRALWARISRALSEEDQAPSASERAPGLPMALFDGAVEQEEETFARLERRFRRVGDDYAFQLGSWDPTAEICDNGTDDDDDRRVDCRDPDCLETWPCRPAKRRRLDLFAMSQCPFANKVLEEMGGVLDTFGRRRTKIDFNIQFIGTVGDDGALSSMHGQSEVDENLRQLCAQALYRKNHAFMEYVTCRIADIRSQDWEQCVTAPMSVDAIRRCAEGERGRRLLTESFELSKALGLGGSPSWMLNNRLPMKGRTRAAILGEFCEENPQPDCPSAEELEQELEQEESERDGDACG